MPEKKATAEEIIAKAYPKGKKIKYRDRVEIEITKDYMDFKKGQKKKVHPTVAIDFCDVRQIAKLTGK